MGIRKLRNTIGRKIKALRKEKGISQYNLSEYTNISREHISCLERAKNSVNVETLYKIAQYFEINIKDFFDD